WCDAIRNHDDAVRGNPMLNVFVLHMLGICEYQLVLLDQFQASRLRAVKRHHFYWIQPATAPRVELKQTFPSESAVARVRRRQRKSFASADASTLIRVGKKHGRSKIHYL